MFSIKNEPEKRLEELQEDAQLIKNSIDTDHSLTAAWFREERSSLYGDLDCYMPLSPFPQVSRELTDYWNEKRNDSVEYLAFHTCAVCTFVSVDNEDHREYSKQCAICKERTCGSDECNLAYCMDCNPDDPRVFKPCNFSCQRHRAHYENKGAKRYWKEGSICACCHVFYLKPKEREELTRIGFAVYSYSVVKNNMEEDTIRKLAYLGRDKIRYFVKYRGLNEAVKAAEEQHKAIESRDRSLDVHLPAFIRGVLDWPFPLKAKISHQLDTVMKVKTPAIRPWKMIRILARLSIIFKRYKEDFYNPEKGRYIQVGAAKFNLKRKLHDIKQQF